MADLRSPETGSSGGLRAPQFPPGLSWFNVDRPLTLADLRGRIVLLYFWASSSVQCGHLQADLRRIEKKHARELSILGVHCPRFPYEREDAAVRQAVLRLGIEHPVLSDSDLRLRGEYAVETLPTLYLIDPEGFFQGRAQGDEVLDAVEAAIEGLIRAAEKSGAMSRKALPGLKPERLESAALLSGLCFPGAVLASPEPGRLYVSDSGHHRVLEIDEESGKVSRIFGGGAAGLIDGRAGNARFRDPQGLELRGSLLYVADTGNHAVREIDLERDVVRTVAGTGERSHGPLSYGTRYPGRRASLSSPRDLVLVGDTLYLAMTGVHQVWRLDLDMEEVMLHAGSGRALPAADAERDGPHAQASFDQPSGITSDGRRLFVVEAGGPAVRQAGLGADGEVETLPAEAPGLQVPLGIHWRAGFLYVADTFNHSIRVLNPQSGKMRTVLGPGDGLREPRGVETSGVHMYVAETAHHRVSRFTEAVAAIEAGPALEGRRTDWEVQADIRVEPQGLSGDEGWDESPEANEIELPEAVLTCGSAYFHFDLRLPPGTKLNRAAPLELNAVGDDAVVTVAGGLFQLRTGDPSFPITIPLRLGEGEGILRLQLVLYYCETPDEKFCYYQSLRLRAPIRAGDASGKPEARVVYQLEVPTAPI